MASRIQAYAQGDAPIERDLSGKTCLVTGATSGHGEACAKHLARMGAQVVLLGRNPERCARVQGEIEAAGGRAEGLICDLSSRTEIARAADEFLATGRPLHLLLNNAGLVQQKRRLNQDGEELTFAVNYLAYFQLSLALLPALLRAAPARIVLVASDAHRIARLPMDDLNGYRFYNFMIAYGRSKLAILYFNRDLAQRLAGTGVTVNAVDPGPIASGIADHEPGLLARLSQVVIKKTFPAPLKAARTALYLCQAEEMAGRSGEYWRFGERKEPRLAQRPDPGELLWRLSEIKTGVRWADSGLA